MDPIRRIASAISEGGWSSVYSFVDSVPREWLEKEEAWAWEPEEEDEDQD